MSAASEALEEVLIQIGGICNYSRDGDASDGNRWVGSRFLSDDSEGAIVKNVGDNLSRGNRHSQLGFVAIHATTVELLVDIGKSLSSHNSKTPLVQFL